MKSCDAEIEGLGTKPRKAKSKNKKLKTEN